MDYMATTLCSFKGHQLAIWLWRPKTHDINAISNEVLANDKFNDFIKLSSTNGDGTEQISNILYTMHRKSNPANLIAGFLNINNIRNKFSALQPILCNAYVDLMGVSETKLDDTFPSQALHGAVHQPSRYSLPEPSWPFSIYITPTTSSLSDH